jgi:hypothetical protein
VTQHVTPSTDQSKAILDPATDGELLHGARHRVMITLMFRYADYIAHRAYLLELLCASLRSVSRIGAPRWYADSRLRFDAVFAVMTASFWSVGTGQCLLV